VQRATAEKDVGACAIFNPCREHKFRRVDSVGERASELDNVRQFANHPNHAFRKLQKLSVGKILSSGAPA
jgi:hypothetical protein